LIDQLVLNGISTQQGQFVPTAGRKPAQAAKNNILLA